MHRLVPIPPEVQARLQALGATLGLEPLSEGPVQGGKHIVERIRFRHGEESAIRTEIRGPYLTRVIADATPLGAALILLEVARRRSEPGRLVVHTGDRSGEYPQGAIEAAWGMIFGEKAGMVLFEAKGDPHRLRLREVLDLARHLL